MQVFEQNFEFHYVIFPNFLHIALSQLHLAELFEVFLLCAHPHSVEQFQHMYGAIEQQLFGNMTTRRNRASVSQEPGRYFSDAMAWISQQKVRSLYVGGI